MNIQIPSRLSRRLSDSPSEQLKVMQLFQSLDILMQATPDFFPDYTNHGIPHVQKVLELSEQLISDDMFSKLRPNDICFLISAVTIHDLGMFLSVDGVLELITGLRQTNKINLLDKYTWKEAWNAYKAELRRFSDERMLNSFGEIVDISTVCLDIKSMKRQDYLVIGEFLRRNHPRLAHEIALNGLPGSKTIAILPESLFSKHHRDLIGLLARSHGMTLRDSEKYLATQFANDRNPCNCPIFYLMAILRLADLLDAGKHRAPKMIQDRQAIYIPVSLIEWRWNQAVDISDYVWDAERDSLSIEVSPESSAEFVQLKNWLTYLQHELDMCWSIISEKYSTAYTLSIHRIKSTILDPDTEAFQDSFLAKEAKLTANPELLKHLVAPLYGNDPSYGVRELIQNAVDACIEREYLERSRGNPNYEGRIVVMVDRDSRTFTIVDNGLGMNEDILLNYYLSAGSSYRYSDSWARDFSPEKTPVIGRTGKFGIGVLATFLLGDHIYVSTQHIDDTQGFFFDFGLDPMPLNIFRRQLDVGTTIMVQLTNDALEKLIAQVSKRHRRTDYLYDTLPAWYDWYKFSNPAVHYYVDDICIYSSEHSHLNPSWDPDNWFRLNSSKFDQYYWKYPFMGFLCNGIRIPQCPNTLTSILEFEMPSISLVDKSGLLHVNLSRYSLFDLPEETLLTEELHRIYIAYLLTTVWDSSEDVMRNISTGFPANDALIQVAHSADFLCCSKGFCVSIPRLRISTGTKKFLKVYVDDSASIIPEEIVSVLNVNIPIQIIPISVYPKQLKSHLKSAIIGDDCSHTARFWVHNQYTTILEASGKLSAWQILLSADSDQGYSEYTRNRQTAPQAPFNMYSLNTPQIPLIIESHYSFDNSPKEKEFHNLLCKYLGPDFWIPFKMEEREKKFKNAFEQLSGYIERIRNNPSTISPRWECPFGENDFDEDSFDWYN